MSAGEAVEHEVERQCVLTEVVRCRVPGHLPLQNRDDLLSAESAPLHILCAKGALFHKALEYHEARFEAVIRRITLKIRTDILKIIK